MTPKQESEIEQAALRILKAMPTGMSARGEAKNAEEYYNHIFKELSHQREEAFEEGLSRSDDAVEPEVLLAEIKRTREEVIEFVLVEAGTEPDGQRLWIRTADELEKILNQAFDSLKGKE